MQLRMPCPVFSMPCPYLAAGMGPRSPLGGADQAQHADLDQSYPGWQLRMKKTASSDTNANVLASIHCDVLSEATAIRRLQGLTLQMRSYSSTLVMKRSEPCLAV